MSTKIVRNKDEVLHVYANVQDETVTVPDVTFSPATLSIHGGLLPSRRYTRVVA